jgi:hypothetical protein
VTLPLQNPLSLACCGDGCAMWWGHLFLLYPQLPPPKQPLHLPPVTLSPCSCVLKPPRGQLRSTSFSFLLAEDMFETFSSGPQGVWLGVWERHRVPSPWLGASQAQEPPVSPPTEWARHRQAVLARWKLDSSPGTVGDEDAVMPCSFPPKAE